MNKKLFDKAQRTYGFFSDDESLLLIEEINKLKKNAKILEIGSYYGRSSLFMLSAMKDTQILVSLDTFEKLAAYKDSNHSFWKLRETINDSRHIIIPFSIQNTFEHLKTERFDLIFIDGNHSYLGVSQDLGYSILLGNVGSVVLCHDVTELFPGVLCAIKSFVEMGVLKQIHKVNTLAAYLILEKPDWIMNPSVYQLK